MESLLIDFSEAHRIASYLIIALAILVEGEIALILAGILSYKGHLNVFNVILFSFIASIAHDIIYWWIGKKLSATGKKRVFFVNLERIKMFLEKTKINNGFHVFISKFAWNLNRIVLVSSGYLKMPIKELLQYSIPASLIWSVAFVSIGYVFSSETGFLKKDIKTASALLTGFIVLIIILENILRRIIKKKIDKR